jgi:uncharacterized protein involved in type VI secretion and phage assembly
MAESGVAVAVVVDNKDDTGTGRVRVRYPWHERPRETHWARVATPMAGSRRGFYFLPEVGDEVLVAFERGDLRVPYVVGSLWNATSPAPRTNGDGRNDIRMIRTRTGHMLTFDDGDKGKVQLELNDGKRLSIDDDGVTLEDDKKNGITIQQAAGTVTIRAAGRLVLQASEILIESTGTIDISAAAALTVRGSIVHIN